MKLKRESKFLSFEEAKNHIRSLHLASQKEWFLWAKSDDRVSSIPYNPSDIYKNEWKNWMDWLGTNNVSGGQMKYIVNHDYFKTWSHNMAYILGFWWADGCIWDIKGNCVFSITQNVKDKYILEEILKEIGSNNPIHEKEYKGRKSCSFSISSKEIVNDILSLGGSFRKSLITRFPHVPEKYLPDFIRGVFDGDGCAHIGKESSIAYICGGSKEFLEVIREKLNKEINGFFVKKISRCDTNLYRLSMFINNARRFRDYIYSTTSNLKLNRKYKILNDMGGIRLQGHHKNDNFLSFQDAKDEIQKNKINTLDKYHKWVYDHKGLFPLFPKKSYKNEWKGWKDFTGTEWLSYKELSSLARKEKIKNRTQYFIWYKNLSDIPVGKYPFHPDRVYSEWVDWDTFLGKNIKETA